jgi:hypothetical protein
VVEASVTIEADAEIGRNVVLRGSTHIGGRAHRRRLHPDQYRGGQGHARAALLRGQRRHHRRQQQDRSLRAPATRHRARSRRARGQFRRDQEDAPRPRQQGQPPDLPRRYHRRRKGQRGRRHHHVQLQWLREAPNHHRGWRVHRLGHAAGGARACGQARGGRGGCDHHRGRARWRFGHFARPCKQVDGYADRLAERYGGKKKATR